jgi:hypothetical protein
MVILAVYRGDQEGLSVGVGHEKAIEHFDTRIGCRSKAVFGGVHSNDSVCQLFRAAIGVFKLRS